MVLVVWIWIPLIKMVGYVTKSIVIKEKEFMSQRQTQQTELFPTKINNLERYSLQIWLWIVKIDIKEWISFW